MQSIENAIFTFVKDRKVVLLSDISREFSIHSQTASDIAKILEKQNKVKIEDRGIAKIVTPASELIQNG